MRFDHIKNCALDAIAQWTQCQQRSAKKAKTLDDEAEKEKLIKTLPERDQSITVLRDMLAEKSQQASTSSPSGKGTTAKVPNYAIMPLATLRKLEQVRDATIGWILKQIEKVEETQVGHPDAAVSTATGKLEASTRVDQQPTRNEKAVEADLDCQVAETMTQAEQSDVAVPTATELLEVSTHIDQQPTRYEKEEEADLDRQVAEAAPPTADDNRIS